MSPRLVLVLGDQLTPRSPPCAQADRARDVVVMAEVADEATYVRHHVKKIAFLFAAMRKFAAALEADGWRVAYTRLDDPDNSRSISGELMRRHAEFGAEGVIATDPGEWRLSGARQPARSPSRPSPTTASRTRAEFAAWAEGRKELRMEWFYRGMRRKTGLLMDGDEPAGGKWNFDNENRKPADPDLFMPRPMRHEPDATTEDVLHLVETRFADHFGQLRPFGFATDTRQAPEVPLELHRRRCRASATTRTR